MPTRHQPILAMVLLAALAAGGATLPALAQQGGGGESTGGSDAGPSGGNESGASGTTGDLSAPQGEKSSSDVQDPTSGTSGTMVPAVAALSPEQVRRVQERLVEFGHDPGTVDGVMGEKTRQALRSFQQTRGLEPTGEPDGRTLAELGAE
jgi:peptidoglycan hydrolase-like protein with peptidoglycan-binding domain